MPPLGRPIWAATAVLIAGLASGGCTPPTLPESKAPTVPAEAPSASSEPDEPDPLMPTLPPTLRPASPTAAPSSTGFPVTSVVACAGRPTAEQVIAVVRRVPSLLPAGASVSVTNGPLCSGIWQYTVLVVAEREPLQVLTRGAPQSLAVVTAGTDVCTVEVRSTAPPALLTMVNC